MLESSVETRLLKALLAAGGARTWIWGTGQCGRLVLAYLRELGIVPAGFVDGTIVRADLVLEGLPVLSASDADAARAPEALVIVASMYADEIFTRVRKDGNWRGTMIAWEEARPAAAPPAVPVDRDELSAIVRQAAESAVQDFLSSPTPRQVNYARLAWLTAAAEAGAYMTERMQDGRDLVTAPALREYAFSRTAVDGLVLEFGVWEGRSLRQLALLTTEEVHGFDSFEGLPEDWTYWSRKAQFSRSGELPTFEAPNVRLHRGWFDEVLPGFLREHSSPVRFLHIDCDLYSSTLTVLEMTRNRLVPGTVIVFDEYLNYPGWRQHEYKAFQEIVQRTGLRYRYLGFASSEWSVAVQIL